MLQNTLIIFFRKLLFLGINSYTLIIIIQKKNLGQ